MKRILAALLSAAMVIGMLSGCAASGSSSGGDDKNAEDGDKVKLSFLNKYPEDPYAQYFKDAVEAFEKENPKSVKKVRNQDFVLGFLYDRPGKI